MDPDVESIVCYPSTKRLINLTYDIKQMIAQAKSVRVVVLINYDSLSADRGRGVKELVKACLLYTSPSPRDTERSRMPSSA